MQPVYVSVVIPTYNRSGLLGRTIPALVNQRTEGLQYEVIFVNNGSSDNSDALLKEAVARYPERLRYYYIPPTGGPSAPRNVGLRAARGEVVVILDDDVLPEPDLVLQHARFHQAHPEPHYAAIGELHVPPELLEDPMSRFHSFPYDRISDLEDLDFMHFWTCNVSVKRRFMLEAGMFDEKFLYYEDLICGYRLANNGMHLRFVPSARGRHLHQLKPSGVPAKGMFTGRWLYPFIECVPEAAVKEKFGILSADLGAALLARRLLRRLALHLVANPLTMAGLRMLGATRSRRNRLTDLYYYALFRRNVLAGYRQSKREARGQGRRTVDKADPQWVDRGES